MASIRTQIEIHDAMSAPLQHITDALYSTISTFEEMDSALNGSFDSSHFDDMRKQVEAANSSFDDMVQNINENENAQRNFNDQVEKGNSSVMKMAGSILAAVGAYKTFSTAKNFVGGILERGFGFEVLRQQSEAAFTTFLGDAQLAKQHMDDLYQFALTTPFQFPDLLDSSRNLIAFGIEAENTIPIMQAIGDTVGGIGGGAAEMQRITDIFGVIQAQGRITAQEVNRLASLGINAYEMLGDAAGVSGMEMKEQISSGAIDSATAIYGLVQGMENQFGGSMENIKGTIAGTLDTFKSSMRNAGHGLLEDFFDPITDLIGNATNLIKQIPQYIGPAFAAFLPLIDMLNQGLDDSGFDSLFQGIANSIFYIATLLSWLGQLFLWSAGVVSDNWSIIEPMIMGITAALLIYIGYLTVMNTIKLISIGIQTAQAIAMAVATGTTIAQAAATKGLTAAQWALNSAMLASPITWIIIMVVALIAIFYAVIAAINKFAGTSISATGIVFGVFTTLGAFLWNLFLGLFDLVLGVINALVNPFIRIANFIGNIFTNPVSSIIYLFQGMADGVLATLQKIASAMDFIFGSSMADTVAGWRSGLKDMADAVVQEYAPDEDYQNVIDELDLSAESLGLKRWEYGDAWDVGYSAGEGLEDKISNFSLSDAFDTGNLPEPGDYTYEMGDVPGNIADTAENTSDIRDSVSLSSEDLKYMRDMAERDTINRFTTAEIRVDMPVTASINNEMDLDGVVDYLGEGVDEAMERASRGVHS